MQGFVNKDHEMVWDKKTAIKETSDYKIIWIIL